MKPQTRYTEREFAALTKRVRGTAQRTAMTNWKDSPEATEQSPMRKVSGSTIGPRQAPSPPNDNQERVQGGVDGNTPAKRESAGSSPAPAPPKYKSKLEAQYAAHLELLVKAGEIRRWEYEPLSLKLASGKRYRPDFLVVLPGGLERRAELHEVKGKWTKNRRDGMTHLKWAAQRYGDVFTFRLIEWNGHGWDGRYVVL